MWLFKKLFDFLRGLGESGQVGSEGDPPGDDPPADDPPADDPPADDPPADDPPADEPPADKPPADEPPPPGVVEGVDPKDFSKDASGVLYYKGTPITDEKGVSYFNRFLESKRRAEEEPARPDPAQQPKGDARKMLKERFPALSKLKDELGEDIGDDLIDFVLETSMGMTQQALVPYQPMVADLNIKAQKAAYKDDPKFSEYETEIEGVLKLIPMRAKLTPEGAKQAVENAYNIVLGKHAREIANKAANKAADAAKKDKKIVGDVHPTDGPPSRRPRKPMLTVTQCKDYEKNYKKQGVTEEGYLDIQKSRPEKKRVK